MKRKGRNKSISIALSDEDKQELDALAERLRRDTGKKITRSSLGGQAISEFLERERGRVKC